VPELNHLWQRFLLASSLLVGLAIGFAVTVFGYSNLTTVDVHWSVLHINGVPLWAVAVIPIALILIAGTIYHWLDGLHHFTEHMRHRHRVHELEAEVGRLRAHLDQVLDMPDHTGSALKGKRGDAVPLPPAELATADLEMAGLGTEVGETKVKPEAEPPIQREPAQEPKLAPRKAAERRKRARVSLDAAPAPTPEASHTNGVDSEAAVPATET
jgi:hypothetical protein